MKLQAIEAKLLDVQPNGGGIIEIPILGVTTEINLKKTAGGGKGTASITRSDLEEMVANSKQWPGPVPIGVTPHVDFEDRAGASPGFIDQLMVRGEKLWARVSLVPQLFAEFMEGFWRGFSPELVRNADLPTGRIAGWSVTGGIFTNRPATDVNYKVAFGDAAECAVVHLSLRPPSRGEEDTEMKTEDKPDAKTVTLEFHENEVSKVKTDLEMKDKRIESLEARLEHRGQELTDARKALAEAETTAHAALEDKSGAEAKSNRLEVEAKRLRQANATLETSLNETNDKLTTARQENLSIRVREVVTEAIDAGVPPAVFDGFESDPAGWMESKYASLEAFESTVKTLHGVGAKPRKNPDKSGHNPADSADLEEGKTDDVTADLEARGINPKFAGVTDEKTARKIMEEAKAKA